MSNQNNNFTAENKQAESLPQNTEDQVIAGVTCSCSFQPKDNSQNNMLHELSLSAIIQREMYTALVTGIEDCPECD